MGVAGSVHAEFKRACKSGNVLLALTTARELGHLSLDDALTLTAVLAQAGDERFDAAAVRVLSRFIDERRPSLATVRLATDALAALPDAGALTVLRSLVRR
jgi:hypothetical protein